MISHWPRGALLAPSALQAASAADQQQRWAAVAPMGYEVDVGGIAYCLTCACRRSAIPLQCERQKLLPQKADRSPSRTAGIPSLMPFSRTSLNRHTRAYHARPRTCTFGRQPSKCSVSASQPFACLCLEQIQLFSRYLNMEMHPICWRRYARWTIPLVQLSLSLAVPAYLIYTAQPPVKVRPASPPGSVSGTRCHSSDSRGSMADSVGWCSTCRTALAVVTERCILRSGGVLCMLCDASQGHLRII